MLQRWVRTGERHVFVRSAGVGPPLVLLHQSPQSSRALLPLIERMTSRFAVFAPDTPGFGRSDPLPVRQPLLGDFADALVGCLDALGLQRVMLYGVHTGAAIALEAALRRPDRIAALVCDGWPSFSAAERELMLTRYLPPLEPAWDGSHLLWLWSRLREQREFFPWHEPTAAARLRFPPAAAPQLQDDLIDLLDAGDGYRAGYRAPFLADDEMAPERLQVPSWLLYRRSDVLAPRLALLPALPAGVVARLIDDGIDAVAAQMHAALHPIAARAVAAEPLLKAAASGERLQVHGLACRILRASGAHARVHLHAPTQPPGWPPAGVGSGISLHLPGHGDSRHAPAEACRSGDALCAALAELVDQALMSAGASTFELHADGRVAPLAVRLAARLAGRCQALHLRDPPMLDAPALQRLAASMPAPAPQASGAHLLQAWQWLRDDTLSRAWAADFTTAWQPGGAASPWRLHARLCEWVGAGDLGRPVVMAAMSDDGSAPPTPVHCTVTCTDPAATGPLGPQHAAAWAARLNLARRSVLATGALRWTA